MNLKIDNLRYINSGTMSVPDKAIFALPEKVLQFGTGVLLRGLPDYFIDKANKQGIFNGRIIVVKSTESDSTAFDKQDCLYTLCVRGMENGQIVEENIINASISRVLSAKTEWQTILACASNPALKIIISNTTEVGLTYVEEKITTQTPTSYPAKLLAFLKQRFDFFKGSSNSGFVIIPTELITDNATQLKKIIVQLAVYNHLENDFLHWLNQNNYFCNSLVDRIVPGKPSADEQSDLQNAFGYSDDLICMCEAFRLWAIEGNTFIKNTLSFASVDTGIFIEPDITLFKELKLRLLNGTHTFNCGTAFLSGFNITRDAVNHPIYGAFTESLMAEIATAIPFEIDDNVKKDFAKKVLERFRNPFINHLWQSITLQVTSKMQMRNVPLLLHYYKTNTNPPVYMATGFAAYLLYMKVYKVQNNQYFGKRNNEDYLIMDDSAPYFYALWKNNDLTTIVQTVLSNEALWKTDLSQLPNFCEAVTSKLESMINMGVMQTVENLLTENVLINDK